MRVMLKSNNTFGVYLINKYTVSAFNEPYQMLNEQPKEID